ncbi:MAG: NAD(P)H-hydrate dehydratase [Actinomycetes bacterium]|jgi:NAD(P)H-hydrate epimerase|nr:NAD(P)H-hydrate dehydratase [Actinomycetes bacterium]
MRKYTDAELAAHIPLPAADAHKYSRGSLLIVAGSRRFSGAALLSTLAATRAGAGYVTLATVPPVAAAARTLAPTVPLIEIPENSLGELDLSSENSELLHDAAAKHDAMLLGPGLGRSAYVSGLVRQLLRDSTTPAVLDADALYAFSAEGTGNPDDIPTDYPVILTPHARERRRLIPDDRHSAAPLVAGQRVLVAKGPTTYIESADDTVYDDLGPSALATAGSGDVLAGIIAALLAQKTPAPVAAALGVRLQALAALEATARLTPVCMNAHDLIDAIPTAVRQLLDLREPNTQDTQHGGV